ncbi:MAG: hypothetical protein PUI16_02645 [Clostridia bacterium]|nr:hypothetical protein [Clostridia bacterium]MDY5555658.1 hypothetical protein [Blautia sp.]
MIDKRTLSNTKIYQELSLEDQKYWFDFNKSKFLHNIDTFYYSVKLMEDFTDETKDQAVIQFRTYFEQKKSILASRYGESVPVYFDGFDRTLNLCPGTFAGFFNIRLECPDWFDIFIAPVVPHGSDGGVSVTCEIVVQLRSYMLWMYGVHESFERSYQYVKLICDYFGLHIAYCQENRIDYCWHSNYLSNPEKFFAPENFYKMRVDRFKDALIHTEKVGSDGYEIDYVSMGKRSDKVFIRIYLKSKEVIEKNYKPWFFKIWLFNGLINRYDNYVYEQCYMKHSWDYLDTARLKFYSEYGKDETQRRTCLDVVEGKVTMSPDSLRRLADSLTPKVNLIMNVEFQTMRKHSKSYQLVPFRDNSSKETAKRIYDYLDNRKIIADYLTHYVFRLVDPSGDTNKSRRDYCAFWKALRSCKMVDVNVRSKDVKLIRQYCRKLNSEIMKKRIINSAVTLGIYTRGINEDSVVQDCVEALCQLNDNDIHDAGLYKQKKARQFNESELTDTYVSNVMHEYQILNINTGEVSTDIVPYSS